MTTANTSPAGIANRLKAENITFAYTQEPVIQNLHLEIPSGDFLGVIGPNGSGKSTLLKLLSGLLPPDENRVSFDGQDILTCKRKTLARSIAWIPQDHHLPFPFTVAEVVMMGRHPYLSPLTFESEQDIEITQQAMRQTQTEQFAHRKFNEISGGEQQRVMLASAIAQEPDIMILDEPTAALDLKYQIEILSILKRLNDSGNTTIIMALHDLHLASKFCRRLVLLKEGQIVKDGSPQEVLQKNILEEVYEVSVQIIRNESDGSFLISPEALR